MKKKKVATERPYFLPQALPVDISAASKTGTWRYLTPVYMNRLAPCNEACPAGEDMEAAMVLASQEDYLGAWEKITQENPLPRVCGRVCFHPCEESCNRKEFDESVSINLLERFLGDHAFQTGKGFSVPTKRKKEKVAIIGSGPAGLSCAYHLASMGYSITIFEAQPKLGGMLRYGIPSYRLPKDLLDQEIQNILSLGVEVRVGAGIGKEVKWEELKGFDAVFLATGAWKSLPLKVPGEEARGIISGLQFLCKVNCGETVELGERVAVIGGGNTAIDAARSALRQGAKPTIIYRRTKGEMPAWEEEVTEAEEESIEFIFLSSPLKILKENGKVKGLECIKNLLGPVGKDGRREPREISGSNFTLRVDSIISCIGETPDFSFLPHDIQKSDGSLQVDEKLSTSLSRVFAGGDNIAQPRTVSYAIGSGKKAAMTIDATLRGKNVAQLLRSAQCGNKGAFSMARYRAAAENDSMAHGNSSPEAIKFSELNTAYFKRQARAPKIKLDPPKRTSGFYEISQGFSSPSSALHEANRCFNCGVCNLCHNCFIFCPDMAIASRPDKQGYDINYDFCKGCCICVKECPRGAMSIEVKK
jgi:NADPH-dependent glutamate synthase beta subunit-like oxidoreductase/Pyruvate/2-oxoacid:ferredoxin oxidoreductase delta subunit